MRKPKNFFESTRGKHGKAEMIAKANGLCYIMVEEKEL